MIINLVVEIQELKRNLVQEVRRNHTLEAELGKVDKRIALLIKNRGNIQEEITVSKKKHTEQKRHDLISEPKKVELYQNLFYLLQTDPRYLANVVFLVGNEQMSSFLDTVILTLFGDAFSPREEFLILSLFKVNCLNIWPRLTVNSWRWLKNFPTWVLLVNCSALRRLW